MLTINTSVTISYRGMHSFLTHMCKHYFRCADEIGLKRFYSKVKRHYDEVDGNNITASSFGQPTPATHPHLLSPGEVSPGLKLEEFRERRSKLMRLIMNDVMKTFGKTMHVIVVIPSATKTYMTEKIPYVFRQNTDFLYLSGCSEPDTALVLSGNDPDNFMSTMFVREPDSQVELWDGPRTSSQSATHFFGVDHALQMPDFSDFLKIENEKHTDYLLFYDSRNVCQGLIHKIITNHVEKSKISVLRNSMLFLHQLRAFKSAAEQKLMRKAGEISSLAIVKAIQETCPGMSEHQLFAIVDYECRMRGAEILAYIPVVACGKNANYIHYIDNQQILKDGELILMDAGCEFHGYAGDITRTWPVNGKFNKYQRILYEVILDTQLKLISLCMERMPLDFMYQKMIHFLATHLRNENVIKREVTDSDELIKELCPHHVSHYLGMDIHDVKSMPKNIPLKPGMVITVEPGLYVRSDTRIAPEFWNTGIRIEDDILLTDTNFEVLSAMCPKTVYELENLMLK